MGDLSDVERGQTVVARLSGIYVAKTATLLSVSSAIVSKVMMAYTNHGMTASAIRNSGRKSTLTERDLCTLRRVVSKNHNHCSTGHGRTEY
jgi:hypothetical protein